MYFANIFSQSIVCLLIILNVSFAEYKFLIKYSLLIFLSQFVSLVLCVKMHTHIQDYAYVIFQELYSCILHENLWLVLTYFFERCKICVWICFLFFACRCPVVPVLFVEDCPCSIVLPFCSFIEDQLTIFMWLYFGAVCSVPFISVSVLSLVPHCLNYYKS